MNLTKKGLASALAAIFVFCTFTGCGTDSFYYTDDGKTHYPGEINIVLSDERDENNIRTEQFHYEGGISSFVEYLNKSKESVHPEVMYFSATAADAGAARPIRTAMTMIREIHFLIMLPLNKLIILLQNTMTWP